MPYRKRYFRNRGNKDKYSIEQTNILAPYFNEWNTVEAASEFEQDSKQWAIQVCPPVEFQGMRKIKHITISASCSSDNPVYYALVYVPQGYQAQNIHFPASGNAIMNYESNQYVMSSGVFELTRWP